MVSPQIPGQPYVITHHKIREHFEKNTDKTKGPKTKGTISRYAMHTFAGASMTTIYEQIAILVASFKTVR
jgi:hypothetical protein